ncbi:MAG: hypothetical protein M3Q98_09555 [Actinomycetota bacterium]|nr:hypothetical protein [Actinomycetota bacterium]
MSIEFNAIESVSDLVWFLASAAVLVASFRRSRYLSDYPIWKSILTGLVSGTFILLWLIVWWVNRERVAEEWATWRQDRPKPSSQIARSSGAIGLRAA